MELKCSVRNRADMDDVSFRFILRKSSYPIQLVRSVLLVSGDVYI